MPLIVCFHIPAVIVPPKFAASAALLVRNFGRFERVIHIGHAYVVELAAALYERSRHIICYWY